MTTSQKRMTKVEELEGTRAIAAAGVREYNVIPFLNQLLDQYKHHRSPSATEWSYCGPAETLLKMMVGRNDGASDGLPLTGGELIAFLQVPGNARKVRREHQILVSFPPPPHAHPGENTQPMIRVERAEHTDEYRDPNS